MATLCPMLKFREFDANGLPLIGGKVYFYAAGTLDFQDVYSDSEGLVPLTNPVILDSSGQKTLYLNGIYDGKVTDADDNLMYTFAYAVGGIDITGGSSVLIPAYSVIGQQTIPASVDPFEWSGGTISASATSFNINLTDLVSDAGAYAIRIVTDAGELTAANYFGYGTNLVDDNWGTSFEGILNANTYIPCSDTVVGATYVGGDVTITKGADYGGGSILYNVEVRTYSTVGTSGTVETTATGSFFTSDTPVGFIIYNGDNNFASGEVLLSQYAANVPISGLNGGPFSNYYTSSGTNTYLLTKMDATAKPAAWTNGLPFVFKPANTNDSTTVNVNIVGESGNLGNKSLKMPSGSAPEEGFVSSSKFYFCHYDTSAGYAIIDSPLTVPTVVLPDGDYGDITVSSSGTVFTLDNDVVTLAKMADGTANKLIGYNESGVPAEITKTFSTTYTDTTGTTYTTSPQTVVWAHGLGAVPFGVQVVATCIVTDGGYAVDRSIVLGSFAMITAEGGDNRGCSISWDSTNVYLVTGVGSLRGTNTSGAGFNLTTTKWKFFAKAWL